MLVELVSEYGEYGHEWVIFQSCWLDVGFSRVCLALFIVLSMTGSFGVMGLVRHAECVNIKKAAVFCIGYANHLMH